MNILSPVISNFPVAATTNKFIAKDNFVVNTEDPAVVKISHVGDNFKKWFINKIEGPAIASIICGRDLTKDSLDELILKELGGQEKAETTLTEIFVMMKNQANGSAGNLLTNGYSNIFYVRDIKNMLRAVRVDWDDGGWDVGACSVEHPDWWDAGDRVFSRNRSEVQNA